MARRARDRERAHQRRVARRHAAGISHGVPRDVALEHQIDAHLARIRASRQYTITADEVWARRSDPVAAEAQDLTGLWRLSPTTARKRREGAA